MRRVHLGTVMLMILALAAAGSMYGCAKKEVVPPPEPAPEATPEPTPVPTKVTPPPTPVPTPKPEPLVLADVFFDFDRFNLTTSAREILAEDALVLKQNPDLRIVIEGHCDERGTNEYNLALGQRRADAVKSYLTTLGVDASRMTTISYGEERPFDPRHNESAWATNRRAHFVIQ